MCDATTSTPPLQPVCVRCAGCMVDLSQCGTTTTSTTEPGQTTTTSTTPGGTGTTSTVPVVPTTSTTVPCQTVRCLLDDGLHASACAGETIPTPITKNFDRVTSLVTEAGGATSKRRSDSSNTLSTRSRSQGTRRRRRRREKAEADRRPPRLRPAFVGPWHRQRVGGREEGELPFTPTERRRAGRRAGQTAGNDGWPDKPAMT